MNFDDQTNDVIFIQLSEKHIRNKALKEDRYIREYMGIRKKRYKKTAS